jgi:conjugative transfer region lipoprotein (TIGR03751 family)
MLGLVLSVLLLGCTTDKDELMPPGPHNMLDLWNQSGGGTGTSAGNRQLMDARLQLRRPLQERDTQLPLYTRTAQNEIYSQFQRLPNPDLVM